MLPSRGRWCIMVMIFIYFKEKTGIWMKRKY
jgi:hypothetical protein